MSELSKEKLIQYVECVKKVETSLYSQKQALRQMNERAQSCKSVIATKEQRLVSPEVEKYSDTTIGKMVTTVIGSAVIGAALAFVIAVLMVFFDDIWALWDFLFNDENPFAGKIWPVVKWGLIIGAVGAFLFVLLFWIIGKKETAKQNAENREIAQKRNLEIQQKNKKIRQNAIYASNHLKVVNAERAMLARSIAETEQIRDDFYSLDVIYPKYRGLVNVCSIYEYLVSGKCESLTGPYGVYNKIDEDIKFGILMEKLDIIILKLEEIKENQEELYYAIKDVETSVNSLGKKLAEISISISENSAKLDSTNETLANIEYNTQVSADCQQFIAWYHFFKN